MTVAQLHTDRSDRRASRHSVPKAAPLAAALIVLLLLPTAAQAQQSNMHHLFDGVRRGSTTPAVLTKDSDPFATQDDADNLPAAPVPAGSLRQPDQFKSRVVLAAHTKPQPKADATGEEVLPPPQIGGTRLEGKVPISGWDSAGNVDLSKGQNGNVSMVVRDASLSKVLSILGQNYHLNIVAANDIDTAISITLTDVPLEQALTSILAVANYTWVERNGIILVTSMAESAQLPADIQGREVHVFELDFVGALAVSEAVTAMLSPIGKMSIIKSDPQDNKRTREMIVVEDQAASICRIGQYLQEVDSPPRQILMEAHILQVTLKDDTKCGVDLSQILRAAGSTIQLETTGLASDTASPAFLATVSGGDLGTVIEALEATTDTKTLGSPKVLVLNHQEAMVHVGDDIGYQGSQTTTQTSTFQNVQFLQVGVLLRITPSITRDDRVLLHVHPEVSTGKINPLTNIPDKSTTELQTDVMLRNGQGMIIGGLINETDATVQSKIPYLGDLWRVGVLFKRSEVNKERSEILVALVPRIQPFADDVQAYGQGELVRASTPLFQGPLCRTSRPFDPVLPDGRRVVKPFIPTPLPRPAIDRDRECTAPWPRYPIPREPYPVQHFESDSDGCQGPPCDGSSQMEMQSEISPELLPTPAGPNNNSEGAVISDHR
jgi:type IV pilus assembly protein PilQ